MTEPGKPTRPRILIVDDDPCFLDSVRALLELQDLMVETATGGGRAIEILRRDPPDLMLLDLCMPELGGREVLRFMRAIGLVVPTVVISGNTTVDDVAGALRDGACDYLKKPYQPNELIATVRNALDKKELEDTNRNMRLRLERSERLHRLIVNNSPDIVFILDQRGRFRFVNSRVRELLDYSRQDLLDTPVLDLIKENDREKAEYFFGQAGRSHAHMHSVELAFKSRQATRTCRHFEVAVWPAPASDEVDGILIYGTARDITERKESEAFINFQAYHDLLTRLPNRALFHDRVDMAITQAQRSGHSLAVMFIDLNRFKVINDSLGHTVGDQLLQAVAQRLLDQIRKGDTLARFGGDEFTLLLPELGGQQAACEVAEKILHSLSDPFYLGRDHELYVGASIGIALYPEAGESLEALIRHADIAMYREKKTGKNGFRLYQPETTGHVPHRLQLEQDLRRALERKEFHVLYQPQVHGKTGQILGVEALVRWDHPQRGVLGPAEFIPVAEDIRLIVDLDRSTLYSALCDIRAAHQRVPGLRLAVNLSPVLIGRDDFVEGVLEVLAETGFPPDLLEIEITESLLMSDIHATVAKLNQLCAAGVQVAVDDFGTGYSSLSYLQKLPVHTLKIDRSFTHAIDSGGEACIVNAIVSMARGLQMNIVAEGVETLAHQHYLRQLGCPMMQGFLFGRPASLEEILQQESIRGRPAGHPGSC